MRKLAEITFIAVPVFLIAVALAMAGSLARSGYLERTVTAKNTGASSMQTVKVYWELDRMRRETYTVSGLLVEIKDGRTLYMYSPAKKSAVKTVMPEKYAKSVQEMIEEQGGPVKGGKKVGTAKVANINCNVFSVALGKGHTGKVYQSTDSRLPVRLRVTETVGSLTTTMDTRVVKLNYNVPDTMFAVPKGTKITEGKVVEASKAPAGKK